MALVRTTITLPEEHLAEIDRLAGPRGRSGFIADAVTERLRHERLGRAIRETAGALRGSKTWPDREAVDRWVAELRDADR